MVIGKPQVRLAAQVYHLLAAEEIRRAAWDVKHRIKHVGHADYITWDTQTISRSLCPCICGNSCAAAKKGARLEIACCYEALGAGI